MFKFNKRGIMGIGTLIIFIATILVAAVAAAVLISTSNVLQQRSLLVGQEARKTITDGIDVFSIMADSNYTTETLNNYEVMMRLSPGSDPLQMRKFDVELLTSRVHFAAKLNYDDTGLGEGNPAVNLEASTWVDAGVDLDDDGINEQMTLNGSFPWTVQFNLSDDGLTNITEISGNVINGQTVSLEEAPITIGEKFYGTVEIDDTVVDAIPSIINTDVIVRTVGQECEFRFLDPEETFCFEVMIGNDDYVLDSREKFKMKIKTSKGNELKIGEDIMFIFASEKGRLTEARARAPDVVVYQKTRIWPLG